VIVASAHSWAPPVLKPQIRLGSRSAFDLAAAAIRAKTGVQQRPISTSTCFRQSKPSAIPSRLRRLLEARLWNLQHQRIEHALRPSLKLDTLASGMGGLIGRPFCFRARRPRCRLLEQVLKSELSARSTTIPRRLAECSQASQDGKLSRIMTFPSSPSGAPRKTAEWN